MSDNYLFSEDYQEVLRFVAQAHEGTFRKGTKIPYIVHPVEASIIADEICRELGLEETGEIIAGALLHDVIEDTKFGYEDIAHRFGREVADLVSNESEDKRRGQASKDTWEIRKQETIEHLLDADLPTKIICMGDKLSNIRTIKRDLAIMGEEMWKKFNQNDPVKHAWYYISIDSALESELNTTKAWRELDAICKYVFGEEMYSRFKK